MKKSIIPMLMLASFVIINGFGSCTSKQQPQISKQTKKNQDDLATSKDADHGLKFEDMVPLIDVVIRDYNQLNQRVLEKSGMELKFIYVSDPGDGPSSEEVYLGMNVTIFPDGKDEYGAFKIKNVATDDYACVFSYWQETSSGAEIRFKRKTDAEDFMNQAKAYGLYELNFGNDPMYLIPKSRLSGGGVKKIEFDYNLKYICGIEKNFSEEDGWYVINLPVDF